MGTLRARVGRAPLSPIDAGSAVQLEPRMVGRRPLPGGDGAYLVLGAIAVAAMQLVGWDVVPPERALLVRFVALAAGIGVLGAVAEIAAARFETRRPGTVRLGRRRALAWGALLALLVLAGLLTR